MQYCDHNLIWIDLEMSGLDTNEDEILEIATAVSNPDLTEIEKGPSLVIHQHGHVLDTMDNWNQTHHAQSGLIDLVRSSTVDYAEAEAQTLEFLKRHALEGRSPMCGNTICQDRRFLARLMPKLEKFFHYRNLGHRENQAITFFAS